MEAAARVTLGVTPNKGIPVAEPVACDGDADVAPSDFCCWKPVLGLVPGFPNKVLLLLLAAGVAKPPALVAAALTGDGEAALPKTVGFPVLGIVADAVVVDVFESAADSPFCIVLLPLPNKGVTWSVFGYQ